MTFSQQKMLTAFAYLFDDKPTIYDQTFLDGHLTSHFSIGSGLHIRWMISRYVGFPEHGFDIKTTSNDASLLTTPILLPSNAEEFINRAQDRITNSDHIHWINKRFTTTDTSTGLRYVDQIMSAIQIIKNHRFQPQYLSLYRDENKSGIGVLDSLLLASLDPYVAKGLGLYKVISAEKISHLFEYNDAVTDALEYLYVMGDWGEQNYPYVSDTIKFLSIKGASYDPLVLRHCTIVPLRCVMSVIDQSHDNHSNMAIQIKGSHLYWAIDFHQSIECLQLNVLIDSSDVAAFERLNWQDVVFTKVGAVSVENIDLKKNLVDSSGHHYHVKITLDAKVTFLNFSIPLKKMVLLDEILSFYDKDEPVGTIKDSVVDSHYSINLSIEQKIDSDIRPLKDKLLASPAAFNDKGEIVKNTSDVYLNLSYFYHPDYKLAPIRYLLERKNLDTGKISLLTMDQDGFAQPSLLNHTPPKVVAKHLVIYCPFDGNLINKAIGYKPSLKKHHKFRRFGDQMGLIISTKNRVITPLMPNILSTFTLSFKVRLLADIKNTVLLHAEKQTALSIVFDQQANVNVQFNQRDYVFPFDIDKQLVKQRKHRDYWFLLSFNDNKLNLLIRILDNNNNDQLLNLSMSLHHPSFSKKFIIENPIESIELGGYLSLGDAFNGRSTNYIAKDLTFWKKKHMFQTLSKIQNVLNHLSGRDVSKWLLYHAETERIVLEESNTKYRMFKRDLSIGDLGIVASRKNFTINLWFKIPVLELNEKKANLFKLFCINRSDITIGYSAFKSLQYHLHFYSGDQKQVLKLSIQANQWMHISLRFDNNNLILELDGEQREIKILYPYVDIANIELGHNKGDEFTHILMWHTSVPHSLENIILSSPHYIDHQLADGNYQYRTTAVDLLGRLLNPVSSRDVTCKAPIVELDSPLSVQAKNSGLLGVIVDVNWQEVMDNDSNHTRKLYSVDVDFSAYDVRTLIGIKNHYLVIQQSLENGHSVRQPFHIQASSAISTGHLLLTFYEPPFNQLQPTIGDGCLLDIDLALQVEWKWSGLQKVYNPEVNDFKLYILNNDPNFLIVEIRELLTIQSEKLPKTYTFKSSKHPSFSASDVDLSLFAGRFCSIESRNYEIQSIQFDAQNYPIITVVAHAYDLPDVNTGQRLTFALTDEFNTYQDLTATDKWGLPVDTSARAFQPSHKPLESNKPIIEFNNAPLWKRQLSELGVDWLPENDFIKVILSDISISYKNDTTVSAVGYVPSAIVAQVVSKRAKGGAGQWHAYTVLWHHWHDDQLVCYALLKKQPDLTSTSEPMHFRRVKFYQGENFHYFHQLKQLPQFNAFNKADLRFGVTACSTEQHSPVSISNDVVLVNKKIPDLPPAPVAQSDGKVDYYKKISVTVSWRTVEQGVYYQVFNSSYAAIAAMDLESRRVARGFYANSLSDRKLAFVDDDYFDEWLDVVLARDWQDPLDADQTFSVESLDELFPQKYHNNQSHKISKSWRRMTVVWRHWSERFYPALSTVSRQVIAEREGNEEAFILLNAKAISENTFHDTVKGFYPDQFYYRIKTQSKSLVSHQQFSRVSNPVAPLLSRKPRKPEISKIVPGDRSVTLFWNLNHEPNLSHYLIYRAETEEDLQDLRWWKSSKDPRIVGRVEDPRIMVKDGYVSFDVFFKIEKCIGIYLQKDIGQDYLLEDINKKNFNYMSDSNIQVDGYSCSVKTKYENIVDSLNVLAMDEFGKLILIKSRNNGSRLKIENGFLDIQNDFEYNELIGIYSLTEFHANDSSSLINYKDFAELIDENDHRKTFYINHASLQESQYAVIHIVKNSIEKIYYFNEQYTHFKIENIINDKVDYYGLSAITVNHRYSIHSDLCISKALSYSNSGLDFFYYDIIKKTVNTECMFYLGFKEFSKAIECKVFKYDIETERWKVLKDWRLADEEFLLLTLNSKQSVKVKIILREINDRSHSSVNEEELSFE